MTNLKSDIRKDLLTVLEMDCVDLTEMILLSKPFKQDGKMILLHHHEVETTHFKKGLS